MRGPGSMTTEGSRQITNPCLWVPAKPRNVAITPRCPLPAGPPLRQGTRACRRRSWGKIGGSRLQGLGGTLLERGGQLGNRLPPRLNRGTSLF